MHHSNNKYYTPIIKVFISEIIEISGIFKICIVYVEYVEQWLLIDQFKILDLHKYDMPMTLA